ncbi:mammalian ependymin-related protein 1-like isoform X1 [Actinia tenebrosa]|uniref:Mammalian ependymin-related protein 1-like isoform X1 n=1 Tax=Actinia tenebrosa TaxID=6105 RepID=A0A6P8IAB4_ACTTE|nr:mammalian ependymin-related protein 1-like isoform X1 [Actinia tenebrosa]
MYTFAALLAFMAVLGIAHSSKPCKSPTMWEGEESLEIDAKDLAMYLKVSYDAVNERVRALVQVDSAQYEYIILYNKHRLYSIVRSTGECKVSKYDKPFVPAQVPDNATFVGDAYFGLKNTGLSYKTYYGTFAAESSKGDYVLCVTDDACIPFFSKVTVKGMIIRESFYNVELGIKDPSVFTPPKSCKEGPVPQMFKDHPRY